VEHGQLLALGLSRAGIHRRVRAGRLRSNATTIDVTLVLGGRSARPGVRLHRTRSLPADEVGSLGGLPITTPARTLLDLAASGLRDRPLEAALDQADVSGLLDFADLHLVERQLEAAENAAREAGRV
jgi:hypothetical protein